MLNKVLRDDQATEIEFAVVVVRAINSRRVERGDTPKASRGVGKFMLELVDKSSVIVCALGPVGAYENVCLEMFD